MNQSRLTPPERQSMVARPNTPLSPFRRDIVGGSAPALSYIANRIDGSPMFSLSPFQLSSPVKNVSGRESTSSSGRSQTPQSVIKPIRETPLIKPLLSSFVSNPKLSSNSSTQISDQFYQYIPSKSYGAINEQHIYDGVDVDQCHGSAFIRPEAVKESPKCESLSKSSSDGGHITKKKKVLTKSKTRRCNILCLATPATVVSDESINGTELSGKVRQGCYGGFSSDDTRYSAQGMSDNQRSSYFSSSPTYDTTSKLAQLINAEHMPVPNMTSAVNSSNISSSDYSSANPPLRRLIRHSSLETIGTNITSAGDEFVWIDSDCRLQHYPWTNGDVLRLLQQGRLKNQLMRISMECVPRLSHLLQRPLIRIACEAQRFAKTLGLCTRHEMCGAIKVVLNASLADSSIKCAHGAATIFAVSGPDNYRQSKSVRAGLCLSFGKFHRWMCDLRVGQIIDEYAAIYLLSAMENLSEEIIVQCLSMQIDGNEYILSSQLSDSCVANNSHFWDLLQPFAHLNAGLTATGMISLPSFYSKNGPNESPASDQNKSNTQYLATKALEQQLLTTCVGSVKELGKYSDLKFIFVMVTYDCLIEPGEIIENLSQHRVANRESATIGCASWWTSYLFDSAALHPLSYYMSSTHLEHNSVDDRLIQRLEQLIKERSYAVLPPLYECIRVSVAHTYYRRSNIIDQNDVRQAAKITSNEVKCDYNDTSTESVRPIWSSTRNHDKHLTKLYQQSNDLQLEINMLKDNVRAINTESNNVKKIIDDFEEIQMHGWLSSLSIATKINWGSIIITPDDTLLDTIKQALIDCGVPFHIRDNLIQNLQRIQWGPDIRTFQIKFFLKRFFKHKICRIIPETQSVVVMSRDNKDMSNKILPYPGIILIFAED